MNIVCKLCKKTNIVPPKSIELGARILCSQCKEKLIFPIVDTETIEIKPKSKLPKLIVEGYGEFELKEGSNTIGRYSLEKPSDIMIDNGDTFMSRQHFTIINEEVDYNQKEYFLIDNKPKNKTILGGEEIAQNSHYELRGNEIIIAGKTKFIFKI